jgi:hypothetical protein
MWSCWAHNRSAAQWHVTPGSLPGVARLASFVLGCSPYRGLVQTPGFPDVVSHTLSAAGKRGSLTRKFGTSIKVRSSRRQLSRPCCVQRLLCSSSALPKAVPCRRPKRRGWPRPAHGFARSSQVGCRGNRTETTVSCDDGGARRDVESLRSEDARVFCRLRQTLPSPSASHHGMYAIQSISTRSPTPGRPAA